MRKPPEDSPLCWTLPSQLEVCVCVGGGGGQLDIQVHNGYNNLLIYYASSVSIFGICTQTKKSYIKGSREPVLLHNYVCVCVEGGSRLNILL